MDRRTVLQGVAAAAVLALLSALVVLDRDTGAPTPAAHEVPKSATPSPPSVAPPTTDAPATPDPSTGEPTQPVPTPPEGIEAIACEQAREDIALTVVSFNTHRSYGPDGLQRIARELARLRADVVLLQEVDRFFPRTRMVDQSTWFARRLGMHVAFGANVRRGRSQYGVATLSRFELRDVRNTLLPNAPGGEQRGLLRATVEVGDQQVRIYNTHLQNGMGALRDRQARVVSTVLARDPLPHVLGGDLNAGAWAPALRTLRPHLVDTFARAGRGPAGTNRRGARIDYVLASRDLEVTGSRVHPSTVSDHHAVRTTLTVPAGGDCDDSEDG